MIIDGKNFFNPFGRLLSIPDKFTYFDRLKEINTYRSSDSKFVRNEISYNVIEDGRQMASFIDLNFDAVKGRLIHEIIIGNQSKLTSSDMDLVSFLKINGYNISHLGLSGTLRISKSNIPYNK